MEGIDIEALKRKVDIVAVIGGYMELKPSGREFIGLCPFHKERTPSFYVVPGKDMYYCFGCGQTGDSIDFVQSMNHVSFREAAAMLGAGSAVPPKEYQRQKPERPPVTRITKAPPKSALIDAPPSVKSCRQPGGGFLDVNLKSHWRYTDDQGNLMFFVARYEYGVGEKKRKETPQYTYGSVDSGETYRWGWGHFNEPRPLFNLKALADNPDKPVLIVEGEKTADAAAKLLPMYVVVTWSGGTNAVGKSDWSALACRKILIWPDNDDPGRAAAEEIASLLLDPQEVKILTPGEALEKGWDAADALESGWDKRMTLAWAREWNRTWVAPAPVDPVAAPARHDEIPDDAPPPAPPPESPEDASGYLWGTPADPFKTMRAPEWNPEHFPETIVRFARDAGCRMGIDPGSIAMMCMVCCASVIHDDIMLMPKRHDDNWKESARLWLMLVGDPSLKKTPAISASVDPIKKIGGVLYNEYQNELRKYNASMDDWATQKKNAAKLGTTCPEAPIKPKEKRTWVDDITQEKLVELLANTDRGLLGLYDELTSFLGGMDSYRGKSASGASKDQPFYLKCYNGSSYVYDRVSKDTVHINRLSMSIIGGIQPGALAKLRLPEDGLVQRFIPIMASRIKEADAKPDLQAEQDYKKLIYHLFKTTPSQEGTLVRLTEEAHVYREACFEKINELTVSAVQVSGPLSQSFGKYTGLWSRLCLVQHCIDCWEKRIHPQSTMVSEETAIKTTRLLLEYLRPHLMVFMLGTKQDGGSVAEHVRWIAGFILARKEKVLRNRSIMRAYKKWLRCDSREHQRSYEMLEALDWIKPVKERSSDNQRPSRFVVNPAVFEMFEKQAEIEAKARAIFRASMAELMTGEQRITEEEEEDDK